MIMDKNVTNKDMVVMKILLKLFSKIIMKAFLYSKVEVLKVIDDNEVKHEEKKCMKKLQVNFLIMESKTLKMKFSWSRAHHKLNFKVYQSRICWFVKILATIVYLKYLLTWSGRV